MPLTHNLIAEAVDRGDDFAFEMKVGSLLRETSDADVSHGQTYVDPVTSKPRQYDYRFQRTSGEFRISLAVECKNLSLDNVMVVSGTPRRENESRHNVVRSPAPDRPFIDTINASRLYPANDFVGRKVARCKYVDSVTKNKKETQPSAAIEGDNDVYDRWAQAIASSHDLCINSGFRPSGFSGSTLSTIVLPLLVVPDQTLWRISYTDEGARHEVIQVDTCDILIGQKLALPINIFSANRTFEHSHIRVLTLAGLEHFLRRAIRKPPVELSNWFRE